MDADNMEATVETVLRVLDNKITRSYYTIKPIPSKNPVKPLLIIFKQEELRNALIQKRKEIALMPKCAVWEALVTGKFISIRSCVDTSVNYSSKQEN